MQPTRNSARRSWVAATAMVVVIAALIRLALNFLHVTAPGMDAAYYPMQTQWLLQHGHLQMPATPLIFWLQALLTKILMSASTISLADAAALSARLFDGAIPPLAAIPVMALGYKLSKGRSTAIWISVSAATLVVMSPPIIRMAGDLQKNSLGIVWMTMAIWSMRESLACPRSAWRLSFLGVSFVLAALTHVGAFAATAVVLFGCLVGYFLQTSLSKQKTSSRLFYLKITLGTGLLIALTAWLMPFQFRRLGILASKAIGFSAPMLILSVIAFGIVTWILKRLWRNPDEIEPCDMAIALGSSFGLLVLLAPIYTGSIAMRIQLMAVVPIAIILLTTGIFLQWDIKKSFHMKATMVVVGILAVASPFAMQGPVIQEAEAIELRELRNEIGDVKDALVIAPHGLEFWAGHLMNVKVKKSVMPNNINRYSRVLLLKPNETRFEPGGRMRSPEHQRPDRGRQGHGPPRQSMQIPSDAPIIYRSHHFTLHELKK